MLRKPEHLREERDSTLVVTAGSQDSIEGAMVSQVDDQAQIVTMAEPPPLLPTLSDDVTDADGVSCQDSDEAEVGLKTNDDWKGKRVSVIPMQMIHTASLHEKPSQMDPGAGTSRSHHPRPASVEIDEVEPKALSFPSRSSRSATSMSSKLSSKSSSKSTSPVSQIFGNGPSFQMWVPLHEPGPTSPFVSHYSFLRKTWILFSSIKEQGRDWKSAVVNHLRGILRGKWILDYKYWKDADEDLRDCFMALLEDTEMAGKNLSTTADENARLEGYLSYLRTELNVFEDPNWWLTRTPPMNWNDMAPEVNFHRAKKPAAKEVKPELWLSAGQPVAKQAPGNPSHNTLREVSLPSEAKRSISSRSTMPPSVTSDESDVEFKFDETSSEDDWEYVGTSTKYRVPARVYSRKSEGPNAFKFRTKFAKPADPFYFSRDSRTEKLLGSTMYDHKPFGRFAPLKIHKSKANPVKSAHSYEDGMMKSSAFVDKPFRRGGAPGPGSDHSTSSSTAGTSRGNSYGRRSKRRERSRPEALDEIKFKNDSLKMKSWSTMVRDHQLDSAEGKMTWAMWLETVNDAQRRCSMTDFQFIRWLPDALSGHARAAWFMLYNPFSSNADDDEEKVIRKGNRRGAKRQALAWLKDQLYDTSRLRALEVWNDTRFVMMQKVPFNKQVDSFFMKVRSRFDNLPLTYQNSVHMFDKLHTCFSRFPFYVKSPIEVDPEDLNAVSQCLAKFKKSFRDMQKLSMIAKESADKTFERSYQANEERLRRQQERPTGQRHVLHTSAPGMNKVGRDGKVMACSGCGSLKHFFRDCKSPEKFDYNAKLKMKLAELKGKKHNAASYALLYNELDRYEAYGMSDGSSTPPSSPEPDRADAEPIENIGEDEMIPDGTFNTEDVVESHFAEDESFMMNEFGYHSESAELSTVRSAPSTANCFRSRQH